MQRLRFNFPRINSVKEREGEEEGGYVLARELSFDDNRAKRRPIEMRRDGKRKYREYTPWGTKIRLSMNDGAYAMKRMIGV